MGEGYDVTKDTFYDKESLYVTWLNVWNGSSEFWWNGLAATTSVNGIKVQVDGEFVCFDSMKPAHRKAMVDEAKGRRHRCPGDGSHQRLCRLVRLRQGLSEAVL